MKIALCLHGLCGGKNSKGRIIRGKDGYKGIKKHLLDRYDIDVFLHSWTVSEQKNFVNYYQPKKYLFEPDHQWEESGLYFNKKYYRTMKSLYYSYQKVNQLKREYETEHNFTYDLVIHTRFDLNIIDINMDLNDLDPQKIYFIGYNNKKLLDHLWISSSKVMDRFIELYDLIPSYHAGLEQMKSNHQFLNHDLIYLHTKVIGLASQLENLNGHFKGGTFPMKKQYKLNLP